jgi:hypothetical protein
MLLVKNINIPGLVADWKQYKKYFIVESNEFNQRPCGLYGIWQEKCAT